MVFFDEQHTVTVFGIEINVPGTARSFIVRFGGEIRFGIDVSGISIDVQEQEITVSMPMVSILSHAIDMESIELLNESTGLFTRLDLEDYTYFIAGRQREIEVRESNIALLAHTQRSAEETIYVLIRASLNNDEYTINFAWS